MTDTGTRGLRFALARVTIEARSPLTIGTGRGSDLVDAICVTDANGIPTIPGSTLTGVLRAWREATSKAEADHWFGFQDGKDGATSRVELSWAHAHDAQDTPVSPAPRASGAPDPVLAFLRAGVVRDHVRINEFGVVHKTEKFDRGLVPKGARFTFELLVHGDPKGAAREERDRLLRALTRGEVRLGAKTRSGFGEIEVVRALVAEFDLTDEKGRKAWLSLPRSLSSLPVGLTAWKDAGRPSEAELTLTLQARDLWIFGTGRAVRPEHSVAGKPHDKLPVTERAIRWSGARGSVLPDAEGETLVPASGVKGALRHRTLYHARRHTGAWADAPGAGEREAQAAVDSLFGKVKEREGGPEGESERGRVILSDVRLEPRLAPTMPVQHVSLDRFTQGPMDGLLFSEAPVSGGAITLRLRLDGSAALTDLARESLVDALEDLTRGRLPLGAGASRGHGYFEASAPVPRAQLAKALGGQP